MSEEREIVYDLDNEKTMTETLMALLNTFPALDQTPFGEVKFAFLSDNGGITMFPIQGPVVEREQRFIYGLIHKECQYPFYVVYRASGLNVNRKINVEDWLDTLGRWLEQQTVVIGDVSYKLERYPRVDGDDSLEIRSIERRTNAYLDSVAENKAENWVISLVARYSVTYQK